MQSVLQRRSMRRSTQSHQMADDCVVRAKAAHIKPRRNAVGFIGDKSLQRAAQEALRRGDSFRFDGRRSARRFEAAICCLGWGLLSSRSGIGCIDHQCPGIYWRHVICTERMSPVASHICQYPSLLSLKRIERSPPQSTVPSFQKLRRDSS